MNIIITLPSNLIQLIKEGKKTIELRKNCPNSFDTKDDVIYICQKGSASVVGYMKISHIVWTQNKYGILANWTKEIAVNPLWIENYIRDAKDLYGFFIDKYKEFDKPFSLRKYLAIKRAPQSFVYTAWNYR